MSNFLVAPVRSKLSNPYKSLHAYYDGVVYSQLHALVQLALNQNMASFLRTAIVAEMRFLICFLGRLSFEMKAPR